MDTVPVGLCQCGCGERTNIAPYTSASKGWVKDRPFRYICGHCHDGHPPFKPVPPFVFDANVLGVRGFPYGLCQCGCGLKTRIVGHTHNTANRQRGKPSQFLTGHFSRHPDTPLPSKFVFDPTVLGVRGIPVGLCQCGCGANTSLAPCTSRQDNIVGGHPRAFLTGHNTLRVEVKAPRKRKSRAVKRIPAPDYQEQDMGYITPCWMWLKSIRAGYGTMRVNGKTVRAHRVYFEREYGPIPEGKEPDHLCKQKACCRPDHLEPVTHAENVRRGPHTKLTVEDVRHIRSSTSSPKALAQYYAVTSAAISSVRKRKTWRDVP